MMLSFRTIALLGLNFAFSSALTEYQMVAIFNNGNITPEMNCENEQDAALILSAMTGGRREVLETEENDLESDHGIVEGNLRRRLTGYFYPSSCKVSCQGFATGSCVAPGCKGYRRDLADADGSRDLQSTGWCRLAYAAAVSHLDALKTDPSVSTECLNLLNQPRQLSCVVVRC